MKWNLKWTRRKNSNNRKEGSVKNKISFTFERFKWDKEGRQIGHEVVTIRIPEIQKFGAEVLDKMIEKGYKALFKLYPEWGKGLPLTDGIGWSSALVQVINKK